MYRDQAESTQQRIERLERELNVAYQEQNPRTDNAELGLALLRFRAQRLAKDVEDFRATHQKEPLLQRIGKRARLFGQSRFGKSLAFVGAFTFGMGLHANLTPKPPAAEVEMARTAAQIEQIVSEIEKSSGATATPTTATGEDSGDLPCPSSTATASTTATPDDSGSFHMRCPGSDAPSETTVDPHVTLSMKDYKELMARSQAFFRAVRKHDGAALAEMAHPHDGLTLGDEGIVLAQRYLRDCFTSTRLHVVSVSAAADDTEQRTCAQVFQAYIDEPYDRSDDVTFNSVPDLPGYSTSDAKAPFVFLYVPPEKNEELSWRGVQLAFQRYGGEFVLTGIYKAYWTP